MSNNPLKLMARKSDIHHKVEMGILFDAYYDTETTDLNKRFAEITQFGGVITDLAGNILHTLDARARISRYTIISPYAWLVQRMRIDNLQQGDPRPYFMGKVMKFFQYSNNLSMAPYAPLFLSGCRVGQFTGRNGEAETYHSYPVLNDDGEVNWDYLRIHENLKKFYFKDPQSGQWIKRDIKAMTIGYNNVNADDQWLWTAAHMAGIADIFMTHLAQDGKFRLDALRVIEAVTVAGAGGSNRLVAPFRKNLRTGEEIQSFSQGAILAANTHLSSELRGITDGITREDGSQIDLSQLHGALADSLSLFALMHYIRRHNPDILRQMERNTDWKNVIDRLTDVKGSFGSNPILAYVDKAYPVVDGKMISLIGTDQHRNAPKVAVVWNLNIDPSTYTYNGKSIGELTAFEWKNILEDSRQNANAPLKIIRAHKSPRLLDSATGYEAGFNLGLDRNDLHKRVMYVRNAHITESVMAGLRLALPRLHGPDRLIMPQPEEELFTFSTLELFDAASGEDIQVHHRIHNKAEDMAQKSRQHIMQIKKIWMQAIQIDESIFLTKDGSATDFVKKIQRLNRELKKKSAIQIPDPDGPIQTQEEALHYKIKILFFARNYFAEGHIQDIGHHFWFEDKDGLRYSDFTIRGWPLYKIDDAIKSGNLTIRHEAVNTMPLIIDRMIEDLGFSSILGAEIQKQLDAYKTLRQNGLPHNHGNGDRWYTLDQAYKDVAKIEGNQLATADLHAIENVIPGAWETFMGQHHDSQASLLEYKAYLNSFLRRTVAPYEMPYLGIDPQTGYPLRNHDFVLDISKAFTINVPDRYLEKPIIDPITGRPLWILPLRKTFNISAHRTLDNIIFRAAGTGKIFHLPSARLTHVPPKSGVYQDFYKAVQAAYDSSGQKLPVNQMALIGNGPYPVFDLRPAHENAQSLHLPTRYFEGMIAPSLAGYKNPPRGIIIRDDHLSLKNGPIRLQEHHDGKLTGWEYEGDIEDIKQIRLYDIKNMSADELNLYGFSNHDQAIQEFSDLFTRQKKNPRNTESLALAISFSAINPDDPVRGMMFYKPEAQVHSCVKNQNLHRGRNNDDITLKITS